MLRRVLVPVAALAAIFGSASEARAACDCPHVIPLDVSSFDGTDVAAGDSVCIAPGTREALRLSNLRGTSSAPITVRNCDGIARIENDQRGYGVTLDESEHVRITGTGDGEELGIFVRAFRTGPDYAAMGVEVSGYNHHIEIDHLEVVDAGFAGFIVKTDPSCDDRDLRSHVQRDIELHHNVVRRPGGEAFYIGNTGFPSRTIQCDGQDTEVFPHWHEGLSVHHNVIEDTGWDGLQVAVTRSDCFIYNNTLRNVATEAVQFQDRGIQIGGGATCDVYGNVLAGGPTIGIFAIHSDDVNIYNNVVSDFATDGIYVNVDQSDPASRTLRVVHNTVIRSGEDGVQVFGAGATLTVQNNLVLETTGTAVSYGGDVITTDEGNLTDGTVDTAGFVDASGGDFRLEATSNAVGAGVSVDGSFGDFDADGVPRDESPDVGAYEYTDQPRPEPGTGTPPPVIDDDDDADAGGGCAMGRSSRSSIPCLFLALVLVTRRRSERMGHVRHESDGGSE